MPAGWNIEHRERFTYRANSGRPEIELKVYMYPEYRQRVIARRLPDGFRIRRKGLNMFLVFREKVPQKGSIPLDRDFGIIPQVKDVDAGADMGRISEIDGKIREKYREASRFWPVKSDIRPDEEWFESDNLSFWLRSAWRYLRERIRPENQEKRWGAEEALERGIGDCDEFTDTFITIARMRGIPSRRITGLFIRSGEAHERHAWAEAYSPKHGWITVDMALNNIGSHTANYVVLKVEEFNPAISDYQANIRHGSKVHSRWEIDDIKVSEMKDGGEEGTFYITG